MALTEREQLVLDIEQGWWLCSRTKEQAIRQQLSCSPATYYATLRRLTGLKEAYEYNPLVVARLRKKATERRRARFEPGPAAHRPR
jgi:hypothetical protein